MEIFRQITANNIGLQDYPFIKELAMEAYLLENEDILNLDNENFSDVSVLDEEIALKPGRKNRNGRIDILASYGGEYLGIIELKKGQIDNDSLNQLQDYLMQKEQILSKGDYCPEDYQSKWVGVLVGSSICPNLQEKLLNGYQFNNIPIAGLVLKRFRSERNEIFVISDTFFKYNYSSKDYSKFIFNSGIYNKGRLINAVIRRYVELNPETTYSDLKNIFPDDIQGRYGVFIDYISAMNVLKETGYKRYYQKDNEVIQLKDSKIATCTQWNPFNTSLFIEASKKENLSIEVK